MTQDNRIRAATARVFARSSGPISNQKLYEGVQLELGLSDQEMDERAPVGRAGVKRSLSRRAARWAQQSLKMRRWIERVEGQRGMWSVTREGRAQLRHLAEGRSLIAFRTDLGVAVWGRCEDAVSTLKEEISLYLSSPPYPLRTPRSYGNVSEAQYCDWLCGVLEPFVARLRHGGNLVLNLGNDLFVQGVPARSLYVERLTIALCERFELQKMDNLIWLAANKAPGPLPWASLTRQQLTGTWENCLWFTNDPAAAVSNNRRVLEAHTERHLKAVRRQQHGKARSSGDGALRYRPGKSFARETPGKIPRNVLQHSVTCHHQRAVKRAAAAAGLPGHPATMPLSMARFLVRFLCPEDGLCADGMAGSLTTPKAAELEGRRWWASEAVGEFVAGGACQFVDDAGFS